jgi:hypothetical protein
MFGSVLSARPVWLAAIMLVGASLSACGDEDGSSSSAVAETANTSPVTPINRAPPASATAAPAIAGVPAITAVAGQPYTFTPTVTNTGTAAVSFSVANLPTWAKFNSTTGQITGTPSTSQVGKYSGIAITLVDAGTSVALPAFTITVAAASVDETVTLSWIPPTENADGSALVDLKGYNIHYGVASKTYTQTIQVSNPGLTTYVVQNLPAGSYYFAVTSYNSSGVESALSPEVSTQVD